MNREAAIANALNSIQWYADDNGLDAEQIKDIFHAGIVAVSRRPDATESPTLAKHRQPADERAST